MGLFSRKAAATVELSPQGPFRATETVTATVTLAEPLDKVTSAQVELGYVNGFRYRWAGRGDAAMKYDNSSLLLTGQVGTDYGSDKDTTAWVPALAEPLVVAGGVLGAGTHQVALRLPSWSPGSSKEVVQWQVRLRVERGGKDVEVEAPLTVLVAAPDPAPASTDLRLIQGERAIANTIDFDIVTERSCYRPGDEVRGVIGVNSREIPTRRCLVAIWFQKVQESHPVEKTPGGATESFVRPIVNIAKDVQLTAGVRSEFPFAITLPADADPTTAAVNSSLDWFVQAKVEFAGATGGIERAQREFIVHTA